MKKHENAIKMLMKNAIDTKTLYGWYEDDNGTRYLTNGHLIIKLFNTYSTVTTDFVGDLPRLNDTKFLNKLVDFVEAHKNGDHRIQLYMPNIKMWDKYNDTDNCYKLEYDKNKYIGFSADYMKRLYTLTGSNCITIIDSKSPIYISGVGIECVFLPCWLDDNYNADNYKQFKEELKACYIQDAKAKEENEKQKALKNTDKIEKEVIYNGFTMWIGGKQYFLMSNKKRVTDEITKDFLKLIAANTTINVDKISESDFKYIKNGINSATITKTTSYYGNEEIYRIETKYNSENFYKNELDRLIIYNGNMEKVDIVADDMSATDEETPKTATIQDNAAGIVKDDTCTDIDKAATKETATNDRKKVLHGFYMTFKKRDIFVVTNEDMKRRYIVQAFINEMINISNHLQNIIEEKRNKILNDEEVLKETKKRITPATIEEIWTRQENHIRITSDNNNMIVNHSLNDFKTIIIDCYSANEGMTPAQEKSFKFFKGISDINNRTTETTQADATQDTKQAEAPAHKSNTCLFVTVAKDIKPEKIAQLQNVANLPTLASVPTYSAYFAHKINTIVNTKRNTNNGRKAHKRTNGATLAECSGVLKIANTS